MRHRQHLFQPTNHIILLHNTPTTHDVILGLIGVSYPVLVGPRIACTRLLVEPVHFVFWPCRFYERRLVQSSFFPKPSYRKTARTLYFRTTMSYLVQVYIRENILHADESMLHAEGDQTHRRAVV
jgi:hypothetical protein